MFKLPKEIIDGINDYKSSLDDFVKGKSTPARFAGVRVPWGIYSHRGGKVFMTRLRIPAGLVSADQLKAIAHMSKEYGSGLLHLTTRQAIQLHNVKIEDTVKIIEYLKEYDLSSRGGGGNTVRNITACVLSGVCKEEACDVRAYALSLSEYLLRNPNSYNLPRKFKVVFSGCAKDCAGYLVNDVGVLAVKKEDRCGFKIFAAGGMGREPRLGKLLEEFIPEEELGYSVEAIKNVFYKFGDRKNKHHNRLRFLVGDMGFDKFKTLYQEELKTLKDNEYIALRKINFPEKAAANTNGEFPKIDDAEYKAFLEYSVLPQKQNGFSVVRLRIPRGDITSRELSAIADLADDFQGIEFRVSQDQDLFIVGVENKDIYKIFLKLKTILKDFLYAQTLLDVVACKGALTCNLGLCNSPGLCAAVEEMIKKEFIGKRVFKGLELKINGCPNSCGQHPLGNIAFYGMAKRVDNRPVPFYRLLLGGRKQGEDTRLAQEVGMIPARNLPDFLREFLKEIEQKTGDAKEIWGFLVKEGMDIAKKILEKYSYVPLYSENKDFYIDWGKTEEFSLDGLGPGECGAGVLDMIESDLAQAKIALAEAEKKDYAVAEIKKAIFLSARALLVVKGQDPKNEDQAFSGFIQKFVQEGIADKTYADLKDVFGGIRDDLKPEEKKEKFLYAKNFLEHINQLYKSMDSALNFPKQAKPEVAADEEKISHILDLKGTPCPINYVKAKLYLENLDPGDKAEIFLDEGEPIANVPKSLENDGHQIMSIEKQDGFYRLVVKKGL